MFRGCSNSEALYSPEDTEGVEKLMHMFVGKLVEAGFAVTLDNKTGKHDCMCRPFGTGFGVTMVGILTGSGASWHGYPEHRYGRTIEIDFNLCYLPGRSDHMEALRGVRTVFKDWLKPKKIHVYQSERRYLYAV